MKKLISLALALVLSLSLIACGAKQDDTPQTGADTPDTTQTAEKQKLIVGFDAEFPPFGFIAADGSYDGFDLAMAEELCSRLGWDFEAVPIVWDSKDAELAAGTINCIWNGFTYTGRENDYTWSDPYVDNSIVMVVKADSGISSLADLAGKSVMAQAASSAVDAINANESLTSSLQEVVELADYNTGFMELKQGSVDAIAADLGVAKFQIASNEGDYGRRRHRRAGRSRAGARRPGAGAHAALPAQLSDLKYLPPLQRGMCRHTRRIPLCFT